MSRLLKTFIFGAPGIGKMLSLAFFLGLVCLTKAQLLCHPETLTYSYVNEMRLWGAVEQTLRVTCRVELDCHGVSELSNSSIVAFDYTVHIYNVTVSEGGIESNKVLKLCRNETGRDSGKCTVEEESEQTGPEGLTVSSLPDYELPVRFTQSETGAILRLQFVEKDLESRDVVNLKKGIISALQTKISNVEATTDTETDSMGPHTVHYRSRPEGDVLVVDKEYSAGQDDSRISRVFQTVSVRGNSRALFKNGEIVDSHGEVTTQVMDDQIAQDAPEPDLGQGISIEELLHSYSRFELKLITRAQRSVSRQKRMAAYNSLAFLDASLQMEELNDKTESKYTQLSGLYDQLRVVGVQNIVEDFLTAGDDRKLATLRDAIFLESSLGFERVRQRLDRQGGPLVDKFVRETYGVVSSCGDDWDVCREILELYTVGGGRRAEEVFELLLSAESTMNADHQTDLINLVSSMEHPSDMLIRSLVRLIISLPEDSENFSALLLALGSLAGQKSVSEHMKSIVRSIILKELEPITSGNCNEDARYADALEAVGNMGDVRFLDRLLDINTACGDSKIMRVALIHATRNLLDDRRVQWLMVDTLSSFDCDVSDDMLNLLLDTLQEQQLDETLADKWPLSGFNVFDDNLADSLLSNSDELSCLRSDAIRYFGRKLSPAAREVSRSLTSPTLHHRTTRALKKHSSCTSWSNHNGRYKSIASATAFKAQAKKFNKRKSCLAHFGIGPKQANVNLYAAYFAGYKHPPKSLQRRLFTKVVANGKVLKKGFTIGTVFLYFEQKGKNIKTSGGKVYAKVGKKVFVNKNLKAPNYKSTNKLYSSPTIVIPLARIPVYITTINVNLKLQARIQLTTHLRACTKTDLCLTFTPKAIATATGSATVNLAAARAGADLTLGFDYYVKGEGRVRLSKPPCVSLRHGHGKANINLHFYYQIRSKVRVKVRIWPPKFKTELRWGKKKVWKKGTLRWTLAAAKEAKIFSNC